jgi:hypothetical protein
MIFARTRAPYVAHNWLDSEPWSGFTFLKSIAITYLGRQHVSGQLYAAPFANLISLSVQGYRICAVSQYLTKVGRWYWLLHIHEPKLDRGGLHLHGSLPVSQWSVEVWLREFAYFNASLHAATSVGHHTGLTTAMCFNMASDQWLGEICLHNDSIRTYARQNDQPWSTKRLLSAQSSLIYFKFTLDRRLPPLHAHWDSHSVSSTHVRYYNYDFHRDGVLADKSNGKKRTSSCTSVCLLWDPPPCYQRAASENQNWHL